MPETQKPVSGAAAPHFRALLQVNMAQSPERDDMKKPPRAAGLRVGGDISIRKIQVFWAVARAGSMTRAARMLEVTQPTLSQQLSALEASLGNALFTRSGNSLTLTEFGTAFLRHAEDVLRAVQEMEDMISDHGQGRQQTIRIGGLPSAMRVLVPPAMHAIRQRHAVIDIDTHEGSPGEILELLYARRIGIALLAANSVGDLPPGFTQIPLLSDKNVLVVPRALDLSAVADPESDLSADDYRVLRQVIHFVFGSTHSQRQQQWFDRILPGNRTVGRSRSFDMAVEMVRSGLGVCLAPALSVAPASLSTAGVRLYDVSVAPRQILAIVPAQYAHQETTREVLDELLRAAAGVTHPEIAPEPPFLRAPGS